MRSLTIPLVYLALVGCTTHTKVQQTTFVPSHNHQVCVFTGAPPSDMKFQAVGTVKATKRTYGGSDEILGAMADDARRLGADALVNTQVGQKFKGPLPWRIVAPTGIGTAVKFAPDDPALNCVEMGGKLL